MGLFFLFFTIPLSLLSVIDIREEEHFYEKAELPLQGFINEAQNFIAGESYGTLFRGDNQHLLKTFDAIPNFYKGCKTYIVTHNTIFDYEAETTKEFRLGILSCIKTIICEINEYAIVMAAEDKLEKIKKMTNPQLGYEATLKVLAKFLGFAQRSLLIMDMIYEHEKKILTDLGEQVEEFNVFEQTKASCAALENAINTYKIKLNENASSSSSPPSVPAPPVRRKSIPQIFPKLLGPGPVIKSPRSRESTDFADMRDDATSIPSSQDATVSSKVSEPFDVKKRFGTSDLHTDKKTKKKSHDKRPKPEDSDV